MAVVEKLIQARETGLSFGNHELEAKQKVSDFPFQGDLYKVKTFREMTKLERNGLFVYESVPGTTVHDLCLSGEGMSFTLEGNEDAQITLELEPETLYQVSIGGEALAPMTTNLGGKLSFSVELGEKPLFVEVRKG